MSKKGNHYLFQLSPEFLIKYILCFMKYGIEEAVFSLQA